jgi:hypothetical protein
MESASLNSPVSTAIVFDSTNPLILVNHWVRFFRLRRIKKKEILKTKKRGCAFVFSVKF